MAELVPCWIRCPLCGDFWCAVHLEHVYDCACPSIEAWASAGIDPYVPESLQEALERS